MASFCDQARAFWRIINTSPISMTDLLIVVEGAHQSTDHQVLPYYAEKHDMSDSHAITLFANLLQKKVDMEGTFIELLMTTFDGEIEESYPDAVGWESLVALAVLMNHSDAPLTTFSTRIERVRSMFADVREGVPANIPCMNGFLAIREALDLLPWTFQQMNQVSEYYRQWGDRFPVPWFSFALEKGIVKPGLFDIHSNYRILPIKQLSTEKWILQAPKDVWAAVQCKRNGKYNLSYQCPSPHSRLLITQGERLKSESVESLNTEGLKQTPLGHEQLTNINLNGSVILTLQPDRIEIINSGVCTNLNRVKDAPLLLGYSACTIEMVYMETD